MFRLAPRVLALLGIAVLSVTSKHKRCRTNCDTRKDQARIYSALMPARAIHMLDFHRAMCILVGHRCRHYRT